MKTDGLIIIGRLSYPSGTAVSNRVHLYCKALKLEKGFPFIINLHSSFNKPQSFTYLGRNDGIPFYYAQKTSIREKRLLHRNIKKIRGLINSVIVIRNLNKKYKLKVLFYDTEPFDEIILFIILKIFKISIIRDCCEIPFFIVYGKRAFWLYNFFLKLRVKMYNQIIVISDYLNNYYSEIFPKNKIFQIPILVDMERFYLKPEKLENKKKIITYIGFMGGNKDGLENLIESMFIVKEKNENVELQLVGSAPEVDLIRLKKKVKDLNLADYITFMGQKKIKEVPSILINSDLLVLARPDNTQAKAGFPTKLGEYLASANPVVITNTGEISKYLKDNESAYLAKPNDINHLAEKIIFALCDENAPQIGKNGYEVANKNFNYKIYGKEILTIIRNSKF